MQDGDRSLWREKHLVYSYEVDRRGLAKPAAILAYLLNAAYNHANISDFSYGRLLARNKFWVLSRILVRFSQLPRWNDEIEIETWGKGQDKLYALRDFRLRVPGSAEPITATSYWLILDRETYRPQRPDELLAAFPLLLSEHAIGDRLGKLTAPPAAAPAAVYTVRHSDIDVNQHVNTTRYAQWLLDAVPVELLEKQSLRSLELNFLGEARLGEETAVLLAPQPERPGAFLGGIRSADGEKEFCRARIEMA